jgi:hypothetical protein
MIARDIHYLKLLNLEGFVDKTQDDYLYNFKCPVCGDSKKRKHLKRGFAKKHKTKDRLFIYCHNCNYANSFFRFLQIVNKGLYERYHQEELKDFIDRKFAAEETKRTHIPIETKRDESTITHVKHVVTGDVKRINHLPPDHKAIKYLEERKIDKGFYKYMIYTENFKQWIHNNYIHNKYESIDKPDPRIVVLLIDENFELFGFQGRSIDPLNQMRYLTIMLDKSKPKIFGLHNIDPNKPIYILEGIFDSFFINNSLAMLGSDLPKNFLREKFPDSKIVYIYDNEPTNKHIIKKMMTIARHPSYDILVWETYNVFKDINEMIIKVPDLDINGWLQDRTVCGNMKKLLEVGGFSKCST